MPHCGGLGFVKYLLSQKEVGLLFVVFLLMTEFRHIEREEQRRPVLLTLAAVMCLRVNLCLGRGRVKEKG